ncbi:MAG: PKD domain-containing protein [Bacteroidetes bacterium]|nr:MAG: PKD domain-containing protein [Bacteroidota bacterium]
MKKPILIGSVLSIAGLSLFSILNTSDLSERDKWRKMLADHPFSHTERMRLDAEEDEEKKDKEATPDLAWEQDYLRTMDPSLGRPAPERLASIMAQLNGNNGIEIGAIPGTPGNSWQERGPNNVGGRTRALAWDPNDPNQKKVWAGGVTGGLWYNPDITDANSSWVPVNNFWDNIAITCIVFDPTNTNTVYVGTGEGYGAAASRGAGIWKSTNGGSTWSQLSSTAGYYFVNDIVVRNENGNGVVYAAVDGGFYHGQWHGTSSAGIRRSTNGGSSWSNVSPNVGSTGSKYVAADLEIGANNALWAGTRANPFGTSDRGGGRVLFSSNGTTWTVSDQVTVSNGRGRVEIACAPSDSNVVYALYENDREVEAIRSTTNHGSSWSALNEPADADNGIPNTDFTRGQAWYDLIAAVDPNDANTLVVGGIDLFRSTNGGNTWSQISKWSNNNNLASLSCSEVHADHHALVFKPGSSSVLINGSDGGVAYTSNIGSASFSDVFGNRNKDYNVTQYYSVAIHPGTGSNVMLAGAQDNGTQRYSSAGMNSTSEVRSGDGGFCFIDQTNGNIAISSYVYNTFNKSTNGGLNFPTTLSNDQNTGKFINPADYDDNNDVLYSGRNSSSIWRIRNVGATPSSMEVVSITGMSDEASHIRSSPYSTTVFVGTDAGEVFKVTNANGSSSSSDITGASMPAGVVSCIEVGASDNELLVTFFNYGVNSVWYTSDGGSNWVSKEGNLPDMPVRWALFNPDNRNEVLLATEIGVWHTTNLSAGTVTWASNNDGLANVRVDMLQLRNSDKMVVAATHGRGIFTSDAFTVYPSPDAAFEASKTAVCIGEEITLSDTSSTVIQQYNWQISPSTFNFTGGTDANSSNPKISFTANGTYNIKLVASNSGGSDSLTRSSYITVGGYSLPYTEGFENSATYRNWDTDNPDNDETWLIFNTAGNGASAKSVGVDNFDYSGAQNVVQRDGLISPPLDLNGYGTVSLSFKHAYRRYSSQWQDSLAVYVSTDCGTNWTRVAEYKETQSSTPFVYVTNALLTTKFTPSTAADWCGNAGYSACKTIDLSAYTNQRIRIKFENISGFGNNLYLDDISVTGTPAGPPPVADFAASNTTPCIPQVVQFFDSSSNTPNAWTWSFTPNTVSYQNGTSANSQNPEVKFNAAGNYTVSLSATNVAGTDAEVKTAFISVSAGNAVSLQVNTANLSVCQGEDVVFVANAINGGNAPQYSWTVNTNSVGTDNDTLVLNSLQDGDIVSCSVLSNDPCALTSTAQGNSLMMTVLAKPSVSLVFTDKIACLGEDPFALSGGTPSGGLYSGSGVVNGEFNPGLAGLGNHTITYTITGSNGCAASTSAVMTVNQTPGKPQITLNGTKMTCTLTAGFYQWYRNDQPIAGANFSTFTASQTGTYKVEVIDNGCKNISDGLLFFMTGTTAMPGVNSIRVYPNPNKGEVFLSLDLSEKSALQIRVIDVNGKTVVQEKHTVASGEQQLKLQTNLAPGTYQLVVYRGKDEFRQSLVVIH